MSTKEPTPGEVEVACARARAFVDVHGDALDRLRVAVVDGGRPASELEEALAPAAAGAADPGVALVLLERLADVGRLRGPVAERVAAAVRAVQDPDGAWRAPGTPASDEPASSQLPVGPRDPIFLTGMLAAFLGRTTRGSAQALDAAGAFLAARWSPDLVQSGSWWAIAAYAHFFSNVPHELSDPVLQWCGRELERGFRTRALDVVRVARAFALCDAQALPGARVDARELVPALLAAQGADGGFPAAAGATRVAATLDAVHALRRLGPRRAGGALAPR